MQGDAARDAARTQAGSAAQASQVQRDMFDISRGQQLPFMNAGYGASDELSRLLGITPRTAGGDAPGIPGAGEQWGSTNGVMHGGQWLPAGVNLVSTDGGKGQTYDVMLDGKRLGGLVPGGASGHFIPDETNRIPTPRDLALASGNGPTDVATPGVPGAGGGGTGLPAGYLSQTFGPEQFRAGMDPGYQWRLQQGAQGVMNTAAAGSGSLSGPALKALMEYNQGAASQEYGNAFDRFQTQQGNIFQRLSAIAGLGQNAAAGVGNQAVTTGGNIGSNIVGAGNAAAAGQIGAANAYGGAASDLSSIAGWYAMNRRPPPSNDGLGP
jgi:hypothetical protein